MTAKMCGERFFEFMQSGCALRVQSVFERALNCTVCGSEEILSVLHADVCAAPDTLLLATNTDFTQLFKIGETGKLNTDFLQLGSVQISLSSIDVWKLQKNYFHLKILDSVTLTNRLKCIEALAKLDENSAYTAQLQKGLNNLSALRTNQNQHAVNDAVLQLLGLGEGLTPSGDDILAGYLFALHFFERATGIRQAQTTPLCEELMRNLYKTNKISGKFLRNAIRGDYNQDEERFFNAFFFQKDDTYFDFAARLLTKGHTSGRDELLGISTGIKALL